MLSAPAVRQKMGFCLFASVSAPLPAGIWSCLGVEGAKELQRVGAVELERVGCSAIDIPARCQLDRLGQTGARRGRDGNRRTRVVSRMANRKKRTPDLFTWSAVERVM